MSEDVPAAEPTHAPSLSFFAQHRIAIIGAGVFVLLILFLLVGIAIGMAKKNFEKKFYLTQIEKLKEALTDSLDKRTELDKEMKELRVELKAKKDHIRDLEDKVADLKHANNKVDAAELHSKAVSSGGATGVAPDPGEAYLRLKAGDCLIEGSGSTSANWQECLKKGKKTAAPSAAH
ncbi:MULTISPECIES: hypothetical protein [Deefgea]|uniref:Uncharacterized protein n=1 Tax=Deefgea chitinilytica TaxID=570276 RepID=A0ABS2CCV9_9NEIS|nr:MULTISPECIES: hypothetical protein [Deefgea]MBM5571998.1 hypothetical protein [Deefgea chitinilytica]MBM9889233.1 hypothetical protein [Deefgea sp. CFH1-16]